MFATFAAFTAFAVCSVGAETNVFALSSFSSSDVELVSNSQLSNGALQILNGGMAVYPNLVPLDSNWTVTFAFTIDYSTSGGFAFVVGDSSSFETAQPEEGYPDVPSSFSVQYVMGEDGTPSFENPALYHLNALFTTQPPVVYTWITYNPTTETLRCYVNTVPEMQQVPSMQADVVMTDYVTLTDGMAYVGFLGGFSTSGVQVEILSWSLWTSTLSAPVPTPNTPIPTTSPSGDGLPVGAVVGIVFGGLMGGMLVAACVFACLYAHRLHQAAILKTPNMPPNEASEMSSLPPPYSEEPPAYTYASSPAYTHSSSPVFFPASTFGYIASGGDVSCEL